VGARGAAVTIGVYFDQDMSRLVARLLDEQLADGGWNCEAENGSIRSSFHTTINVLEGLLAHERATGGSPESIAVRRRGEEYLLERQLLRRKSTGDLINPALLRSKQQPDGTWLLENTRPGRVPFSLEHGDGRPSRWNTLRALRVLRCYEKAACTGSENGPDVAQ